MKVCPGRWLTPEKFRKKLGLNKKRSIWRRIIIPALKLSQYSLVAW